MTVVLDTVAPTTSIRVLDTFAIHTWNGDLALNDREAWPRYYAREIAGLRDLPDPDDVREEAVGRWGEIPRRSVRRGKTITYTGQTFNLDDPIRSIFLTWNLDDTISVRCRDHGAGVWSSISGSRVTTVGVPA